MDQQNQEEMRGGLGKVQIADDVIAIIVELALNDVAGIYASEKRKNKKSLAKGIEIRVVDGSVVCDLELYVATDIKIPQIAEQVQTKVKSAIENMTGLAVQEVNLRIAGLTKEEPADE